MIWTAIAQDITNHKQTEIEAKQLIHSLSGRLEARTTELAVSQTRLQKLADNVPVCFMKCSFGSKQKI